MCTIFFTDMLQHLCTPPPKKTIWVGMKSNFVAVVVVVVVVVVVLVVATLAH